MVSKNIIDKIKSYFSKHQRNKINGYKTKIRESQESRRMIKTCGDTVAPSIEVPRKVFLLLCGIGEIQI